MRSAALARQAPPPPEASGSRAAEVVLEPDDVVLAEVGAPHDLDDHELAVVDVADAVRYADLDVDALPRLGDHGLAVDHAGGPSRRDDPVLRTVLVGLVGQPRVRLHGDALDLEALA